MNTKDDISKNGNQPLIAIAGKKKQLVISLDNILQNIFFCVLQKKEIPTCLEQF